MRRSEPRCYFQFSCWRYFVVAISFLLVAVQIVWADTTPSSLPETPASTTEAPAIDPDEFRQSYVNFIKELKAKEGVSDAEKMRVDEFESHIETGGEISQKFVIIRGGDGVPFPDPASISESDVFTATPTPEATETPLPTSTPWQKPTRCRESKTEVEIHSPERDPKQIDWDVLFVYEDFIPMDPVEVYGSKARVHGYNPQNGKGALIRMEIYQVPCIPYRTRKTANAYYHDTGVNALKNYDTDPTGKGKLHPWVSNKLYGNKKEAPRKQKRFRKR